LDGPFQLHIDMALKAGATPQQIREVLLHMALYASFPKVLPAVRGLRAYLAEKGIPL
jgi:alkylhydroperoxidase/carboxymuconolactone decarboxylase family protein YurZ